MYNDEQLGAGKFIQVSGCIHPPLIGLRNTNSCLYPADRQSTTSSDRQSTSSSVWRTPSSSSSTTIWSSKTTSANRRSFFRLNTAKASRRRNEDASSNSIRLKYWEKFSNLDSKMSSIFDVFVLGFTTIIDEAKWRWKALKPIAHLLSKSNFVAIIGCLRILLELFYPIYSLYQ